MLFRIILDNEKKELIPSSYIVFFISSYNKRNYLCKSQMIELNNLVPLKGESEAEYIESIQRGGIRFPFIVSIVAKLQQANHDNSIVLASTSDDKKDCGFNFIKCIAGIIRNYYGYPCIKFTNDITRSMRQRSILSDKGIARLFEDVAILKSKIDGNK